MIVRALALTALLAATSAAAQSRTTSPAATPSSAGAGDPHTPSAQIQDPTLGSGQAAGQASNGLKGGAAKTHRSKHKTADRKSVV